MSLYYLRRIDAAYRKLPVSRLNATGVAQQVLEDLAGTDHEISEYEDLREFIEGLSATFLLFLCEEEALQILIDARSHISPRTVLRSI